MRDEEEVEEVKEGQWEVEEEEGEKEEGSGPGW